MDRLPPSEEVADYERHREATAAMRVLAYAIIAVIVLFVAFIVLVLVA